MSTFLQKAYIVGAFLWLPVMMCAQQVSNSNFEDWSGAAFDGNPQPKGWNASNVTQFGFKFNFAHKEAGHDGGFSMMVQDQDVGAAGITETSPGYFALGQPWVYVPSLTEVSKASAGTSGGIDWKHRPDSMSVWIRRTGNNTDKEDFYLLYYSWTGTAKGEKYKAKNGSCTSHSETNEESDIRLELNGNECGTAQKATQIAEGMWREKKTYANWTNIRVPIYYFNNEEPTKMNIIFSASNYPNYRANSGLYTGNSLYVDDVELIYASSIQKLYIGGKEWKGFDPNSTDVQTYSLGETATEIPEITARRGAGSLTNAHGKTVSFPGRDLSGSEITVTKGDLVSQPTTITVKAGDGKSTTTYRIQFQRSASTNATLAELIVNGEPIADFRPGQTTYNVELPYGTTAAPVVTYTLAEDGQTATVTQASSPTGTATIVVTAADKATRKTYTIHFSVGRLTDVTLKDIKVNGKSIPGFSPSQTIYKVSLPVGTTTLKVEPVSAYPAGEQTIVITPSTMPTGDAINGTTVQVTVSAPGSTSSKVYKLTVKIEESSYSYLADLQVSGDQISDVNPAQPGNSTALAFDPELTTYYVNLKMGTKTMPQILYTPGDEFQTITKEDGGIDGTTRISVVAGNKSDQTVYKLVFSTAKSEISTLAGINIDGKPLEGFSPDITNYSYVLPVGTTTLPEIEPVAHDEFQEITMVTGGVNGKTRISVTAGNGSTTNYYIDFSVSTYSDNTLKSLSVEGYDIGFEPETNEYWVNLAQGTTVLPKVTYELQDPAFQTVSERPVTGLTGDYKITVRPQSGASRTYIIHFTLATSSNTQLAMIYVDGAPLADFHPDTLHYTIVLPEGVSTIPAVTFDKAEAGQRVLSVLENKVQIITVTAESGAKREYTVTFIVQVSQNAFLDMIYLDGEPLPGFRKDSLNYSFVLAGVTCPAVTVDKAAGQQVTIVTPYAAGRATVMVKPEEGAANTYTIDFEAIAPASARLAGILVNGVALEGFSPDKTAYSRTYEGALPEVAGVPDYAEQTVKVLWKDSVAWIHVQDTTGNTAAYSIAFSHTLSANHALEAIYADGVLIDGFDAATLTYDYTLPAGSTYPVLSYKAASEAQVVFFGQLAAGQWGISVIAEDGTKADYTVRYTIAKYNDATLKNIIVEGYTLPFEPNTFSYDLTIDEGALLPQVTVETRDGQTVMITNANDTHQQINVFAESGDTHTYIIAYARKKSNNAFLADILIDGVSIEGFDPNTADYVDSIPWRSKFVPNVFPVAQLSNQTVTTCFCRPDGVTRIRVEAQDGTTRDYSVAFPVRKSANTRLGDLYLDSEEQEIAFLPDKTDYVVTMPYTATACPKIIYDKDEPEQRIDFISRPLGQASEITVTAENGDTRTYSILFQREVLGTPNQLAKIRIVELDQELNLNPKTKRDFDIELPFGARSMTVEYEKAYEQQTVFIQPGGVNAPTVITVKANNDTVADEVYTLTPVVLTADPAVLSDIKVNGVTIPGFNAEQFAYIVPFTATDEYKKPSLKYTLAKGAEIDIIDQTSKHWQAKVTYGDRTNIYNVWYYYIAEQVPNMEFTDWETAEVYTDAQKPSGWKTVTDALGTHTGFFTFDPDQICTQSDAGIVDLKSKYSTPGGGNIPGFLTLGNITGSWAVAGGTSFSITGGISFHNSPDIMQINYKSQKVSGNNQIQYTLTGADGEKTLEWNNSETADYTTYTFDLAEANAAAGDPTLLNIVLNSYYQIDGTTGNPLVSTAAEMLVDWMKFSYNHTLTGLTVDGIAATLTDKAFSATLTDPERIEKPVLVFTGEVADQAPQVTWKTPTVSGNYSVRKATIRNYAENGTDYTDYTLEVKRPLDTKNQLADLLVDGAQITGFTPAQTAYSVVLPSTRRNLPDMQPVPASSLQTVTTSFNPADSTMTVTVKPEKGTSTVYTVKFTTNLSDATTLANITADGVTFEAETRTYELTAERLPIISFDKLSDRQTVSLLNGVITVTAENGAQGTYTITCLPPEVTPSGVITEFSRGDNVITGFGGAEMSMEADRPSDHISFIRQQASDSVVFIQSPTQMTWTVPGTGKTYTWTYTTTLSDNAGLAGFTVGGENYGDFITSELNYELLSDTTLVLSFLNAIDGQQLATTVQTIDGGAQYTTVVTAPNGVATKTYTVKVTKPLSSDASLSAIMLDGEKLEDFYPAQTDYTVVLPLPADGIKRVQPKMPDVIYVAGHDGQTITLEAGQMNGDQTVITVLSQDGKDSKYYTLSVEAEKSHCSNLSGITINGEALDHFEGGRHFYSVSLKNDEVEVDYRSDDRFQTVSVQKTVVKEGQIYQYTLHVTAEDGTSSDYLVELYKENQSNDAQLAEILLNGYTFVDFERALNPDLRFDGGNNSYDINLPSGSTVLPEVSAQLKMDGQTVEITQKKDSILLDVTAVDGVTHNTYVLRFLVPLSTNADLAMIYLNGDSVPGFDPANFFYQIDLPVGTHELPEVAAQKSEGAQLIQPVNMDMDKLQATIVVQAEDRTRSNTYVVVFHFTQSDADTLAMIYEDGVKMEDFEPSVFYYTRSLPVGTIAFPELGWEEADDWQTVLMDTAEATPSTLVRQIMVTAESGKKNTYTVSYTILKSDIDTLQMIFVDQKQLPGFDANTVEYYYQLTASEAAALEGELPLVEYITGDDAQTVVVSQTKDSLSGKSLLYKSLVSVTAATGKMRTYTIHYPVELSSDATLNMIMLGGKPLANFDSERTNYKVEISWKTDIPVVSVIKKEDVQTYEIRVIEDTVLVDVWAEDGTTNTYTMVFERVLSDVTTLKDIQITKDGMPVSLYSFDPEVYDYTIVMPYDSAVTEATEACLPDMKIILSEPEQDTLITRTKISKTEIQVSVTVIAQNGDEGTPYVFTFRFTMNDDAYLTDLRIKGVSVKDFQAKVMDYTYRHPFGSDASDFVTVDSVQWVKSDPLAKDTIFMDEDGIIRIVITAQDDKTRNTYSIQQIVGKDTVNQLAMIWLDSLEIQDFDPEETFYTYILRNGSTATPKVTAEALSENAEVSITEKGVNDTTVIYCTAQDGSERVYRVFFKESTIDDALTPTPKSIFLRRIPGSTQLFVATIRKDVTFVLHDRNGHLVYYQVVPDAEPNSVDVVKDGWDEDVLLNVDIDPSSGLIVDLIPRQVYFYSFVEAGSKIISSGKLIALP
jgi:hypothetical protein